MALFVRMIRKMIISTQVVNASGNSTNRMASELQMNTILMLIHIVLISGLTVLVFLEEIMYTKLSKNAQNRTTIVYYFMIGALDIFVSYVTWFFLSEEQSETIMLKDESSQFYYPAFDVIDNIVNSNRNESSSLNSDLPSS
jgi:RsiW-degrading membrane proteinase PrsW (M82 family)